MNKNILIVIVVSVVILAAILLIFTKQDKTETSDTASSNSILTANTVNQNTKAEDDTVKYSLFDVEMHSSADDCWIILHGKVYEVTDYISFHPGGSSILTGCGHDAADLFEDRPNGSGSHSDRARDISLDYLIGDLQ